MADEGSTPSYAYKSQLDLFNDYEIYTTKIPARGGGCVLIDIDSFDQSSIFKCAERLHITNLVDLRPLPVFRRPRFYHESFFGELEARRIFYAPIVHFSFTDTSFKNRRRYFEQMRSHANRGQTGLIISKSETKEESANYWLGKLSKSLYGNIHAIPIAKSLL